MAKERPKKKLRIYLREGFTVDSITQGQVTLEVEIPADELLNLYAMVEATEFEDGATFDPASITFGFPTPPEN